MRRKYIFVDLPIFLLKFFSVGTIFEVKMNGELKFILAGVKIEKSRRKVECLNIKIKTELVYREFLHTDEKPSLRREPKTHFWPGFRRQQRLTKTASNAKRSFTQSLIEQRYATGKYERKMQREIFLIKWPEESFE